MTRCFRTLLAAAAALVLSTTAFAQTTGRISGHASRTRRAACCPGVTVTVNETRTGFTRDDRHRGRRASTSSSTCRSATTPSAAELAGLQEGRQDRLRAGGRRPPHAPTSRWRSAAFTETVEVTVAAETVNTISGEVARTVDRGAGAGPGAQRPQLHAAGDAHPGRAAAQPQRARHHDRPRHQHVDQRQPQQRQPAHGRRRLQHGLRAATTARSATSASTSSSRSAIKTSNFSAEYGRNSGAAINVVTRSGTNTFKGSAFEYLRRDEFDANDYFNELRAASRCPS